MFSRAFSATVVMIATLTTSVMSAPATTTGQCNSGSVQCCNSVKDSDAPGVGALLGLLGIVLGGTTQVGMDCSPLSVVGVNPGAECSQQTVCCNDNSFNGVVALGCTPINLNL